MSLFISEYALKNFWKKDKSNKLTILIGAYIGCFVQG